MAKKPTYRIWITVSTGPRSTPVTIVEFLGRKRAFVEAGTSLLRIWRRIRMLERGELRAIDKFYMTREQWLKIWGEKNSESSHA